MQLRPEKKRKIGKFIANASLSLLCLTTSVAQTKAEQASTETSSAKKGFFYQSAESLKKWAKWSGNIGFLGYQESNGRVQAIEPAILLNAEFDGERIWSTKLVFDSLTGASPNGAINSNQPQTFTSPSGKASYTVNPGEQPLFNQFKDTRVNLVTSWTQPLSRLFKVNVGFNGSKEYDYLSMGLNTSLTKESEDKNSSWSLGFSYTADTISPVGAIPIPLATMQPINTPGSKDGTSENKSTYDFLLGYSQVINRFWIVQTNLSVGSSSGYMNDPYKLVTIYDDNVGATLGDPISYIFESRPDKRLKTSFYIASKNYFKSGILNLSYRFLNDDWGLTSHTIETSFNFRIAANWRLEPGFRYYLQNAVDFYKLALGASETLPQYITADYRLGDLTTIAPGLKLINKLENEKELSFILRLYHQMGDSSSFKPVGSQVGQNLIPDTDAVIVQINYSF